MSYLQKFGIISKSATNKSAQVFEYLIPDIFATEFRGLSPSQFIAAGWHRYEVYPSRTNNLNGRIFEYLLAVTLVREEIFPFFMQAKVAFVPNVNYDILLYTNDNRPICISAKTSLRERYKQAALEAFALKNVHRRAKSYLLTLDAKEAKRESKKLITGDVLGLDAIVVATSHDFDKVIETLKTLEFKTPEPVEVISASHVVTAHKIQRG